MNTNRIDITDLSHDEFLEIRKDGIGGSDASIIKGASDYISSYELWGIKSGLYEANTEDSIHTFFGRFFENDIAKLYTYWDGTESGFIDNFKADNKIIDIEDRIYHYKDQEFEFLQCSPDRIVTKHPKYKGYGVLEIKTILGFVKNKYDLALPPAYLVQAQHNLMVTGLDWLDFAVLQDGRFFKVFHIERNEEYIQNLRRLEIDFWHRVLKTKQAILNDTNPYEFEPEIDGTEAFSNFLKRQFKGEEKVIQGNVEDIRDADTIMRCNEAIKELEAQKREAQNRIQFKMMKESADMMELMEGARFTWRPRKDGVKVFNFYNK